MFEKLQFFSFPPHNDLNFDEIFCLIYFTNVNCQNDKNVLSPLYTFNIIVFSIFQNILKYIDAMTIYCGLFSIYWTSDPVNM